MYKTYLMAVKFSIWLIFTRIEDDRIEKERTRQNSFPLSTVRPPRDGHKSMPTLIFANGPDFSIFLSRQVYRKKK